MSDAADNAEYKVMMNKAVLELDDLVEELEVLDDKREKVQRRIFSLRDLIFALSNVLGEDPYKTRPELFPELIEPETGFTDAVREVLSDEYQSPVDIRDELKRRRFNLEKYRNPLAAIHQILSRLVASKEVEQHEEKKLYKRMGGTLLPSHGYGGGAPILTRTAPIAESQRDKLIRNVTEATQAKNSAMDTLIKESQERAKLVRKK